MALLVKFITFFLIFSVFFAVPCFISLAFLIVSFLILPALHFKFSSKDAWKSLPETIQNLMLYGSQGEEINFRYDENGRVYEVKRPFEGVIPNMERRYRETDSSWVREEFERYQNNQLCGGCHGYRLKSEALSVKVLKKDGLEVRQIPRAREVGQSWLTTPFTTLISFFVCLNTIFWIRPRLVLVNGPRTCVPVVAAACLFEIFLGWDFCLVFVESFCRTRSLSLTGKILYGWADRVVVHHEYLVEKFPKAEYLGCIY